jgi:hypothetical protein
MQEISKGDDSAVADDGFAVRENRSTNSPIIGKMVKFTNDAKFVFDKTSVLSAEMTLVVVGIWTGWVHWVDGQTVEHRQTRAGQVHPDKEDMPDRDQSLWPMSRFTNGPEDPWKDTRYTHMIDPQTGADYTLVGDTYGMRKGVSELKSQIGNVRTAHPGALPIVQLRSGIMPSKKFGPKPYPVFLVVGWHGRQEGAAPLQTGQGAAPLQVEQQPAPRRQNDPISSGLPAKNDDMDDDIPF